MRRRARGRRPRARARSSRARRPGSARRRARPPRRSARAARSPAIRKRPAGAGSSSGSSSSRRAATRAAIRSASCSGTSSGAASAATVRLTSPLRRASATSGTTSAPAPKPAQCGARRRRARTRSRRPPRARRRAGRDRRRRSRRRPARARRRRRRRSARGRRPRAAAARRARRRPRRRGRAARRQNQSSPVAARGEHDRARVDRGVELARSAPTSTSPPCRRARRTARAQRARSSARCSKRSVNGSRVPVRCSVIRHQAYERRRSRAVRSTPTHGSDGPGRSGSMGSSALPSPRSCHSSAAARRSRDQLRPATRGASWTCRVAPLSYPCGGRPLRDRDPRVSAVIAIGAFPRAGSAREDRPMTNQTPVLATLLASGAIAAAEATSAFGSADKRTGARLALTAHAGARRASRRTAPRSRRSRRLGAREVPDAVGGRPLALRRGRGDPARAVPAPRAAAASTVIATRSTPHASAVSRAARHSARAHRDVSCDAASRRARPSSAAAACRGRARRRSPAPGSRWSRARSARAGRRISPRVQQRLVAEDDVGERRPRPPPGRARRTAAGRATPRAPPRRW